jgi:ABC-type multidrug transport system fused ATPase/permease subunit
MDAPQGEAASTTSLSGNRERLVALLGDRKRTVAGLAVASVASGLTEVAILALVAQIATLAVRGGGAQPHQGLGVVSLHASKETLFIAAFALVCVRVLLQIPLSTLPAHISSGVQARLRRQLFDAYTRASWAVQASDREGHLQETMTSQVLQATGGALQATQLVTAALTFLVLMASSLAINTLAAVAIFAAAVVLFAALRPLNVLGARYSKRLSRAQLDYAGGVNEANRLAEETQVFGVGEAQRRGLDVLIAAAQRLFFRTQLIGRISPSLYQSAMYFVLLGALLVLTSQSAAHTAALTAVVLMIVRAGTFGQQVSGAYQALRQSLPFIERLQTTIDRYAASAPQTGSEPVDDVRTIAFEDVSFAYTSARPVLRNVSFEVEAGEAVGMIGPSGAGKSTMIQLLLQLRRPVEGSYLVNGIPVEELAREDWHRCVAYVPQHPKLIHASVAENISYLRGLDRDTIERAGRLARIHDEVVSWPQGYDTIVGPRADAVSGGQQQRICLARALAARPSVLVLDEPTSALDPHSEALIQESLQGLRRELTLFVIAHRMSTLSICDRVMVIMDGRLVAFESTELLQRNNAYYRSATAHTGLSAEALR